MNLRPCALLAAALAIGSCNKATSATDAPRPPAPPPVRAPVEAAPPRAVENAAIPSASGQSEPDCVGKLDLAPATTLKLGARTARQTGYKLSFLDSRPDGRTVFGVLGSINEASGENLLNLRKYVAQFAAAGAEAILVGGDVGESQESIERVLAPLAESGLPVFVIAGNRECRATFNSAVAGVQKAHPNVVNLDRVRHVELDDVELLSLPGYHDRRYIRCETGCQYFREDVDALEPIARAAKKPVVLVAHGPPKGSAATAIDHAAQVGNVGDASLNTLLDSAGIRFGIFANIKEAGGRATDLSGAKVIAEDAPADQLYLNPGPADSIAWAMNDGTQSLGMAALLTIEGDKARYKIFRAAPLTPEERDQAQALASEPGAGARRPANARGPRK